MRPGEPGGVSVTETVSGRALRGDCRVVVVNWNSGGRLVRCIDSIPPECETVVVDNGSDDSLSFPVHPGIRVLRNRSNLGFAAAANKGAEGCSRRYLLFLNPDITFADSGSADAMLQLLEQTPDAAAATGRLESLETAGAGRTAGSLVRPLPTLASAMADVLFVDELLERLRTAEGTNLEGPAEIEQAPGACLLIRTEVFQRIGGFDVAFYPAWFEDVDLCRRLRDLGLRILLEPRSLFFHEGGYSLERLGRTEFNRIFYGNMIRYFRKHHGLAASAVLRAAVLFGNAGRRLRSLF